MRIVFLGHNASRSGAPMMLLHLIRWIRTNTDASVRLVLESGGSMLADYEKVADTVIIDARPVYRRLLSRMAAMGRRRLFRSVDGATPRSVSLRQASAICSHADVVYANTVATAPLLMGMPRSTPRVFHLHEMRYALQVLTGTMAARAGLTASEYLTRTLDLVDAVIVPAPRSRMQIVDVVPSARDKVHVVPEMIDVAAVTTVVGRESDVRAELGIPASAAIVVGCGTVEWRKGTDIFVQIGAKVIRSSPAEAHFVWIGVPWSAAEFDRRRIEFEFDVAESGMSDRIHAVPATDDPTRYLAMADVFLLSSREDPFPLVVLEAAALGKPIVCFDTVGIAELVAGGAGITVPYLDVTEMAAAVTRLIESPDERRMFGQQAMVSGNAHDYPVVAPKLLDLIVATARGH
jgi:glycosyltransferase involved in cell wall biosynthesis